MTTPEITLHGMTWNHSRGYLPLVAAAQRFEEQNPGVRMLWDKRSLKDFEEYPLDVLARRYDLIVLDHPLIPTAAPAGCLLPLDAHLPAAFLEEQRAAQVGKSHDSYRFEGRQWALALDAAAPVAIWRADLCREHGTDVPTTWEAVLDLARAGNVEIPAAPIYSLMNFYTFCLAHGEAPFADRDTVVGHEAGLAAIETLRELISACAPGCWNRNPIDSHEFLASAKNRDVVYCPLAYGYSNYAREGYAAHRLTFGAPPVFRGGHLRTTLGGTGLGLSALRPEAHRSTALRFAQYVADGTTQRCLSTPAGGQPGHRSAWTDARNNQLTGNCFRDTLETVDRAWVRPRYPGYARFQEAAGPVLQGALRGEQSPRDALDEMNRIYRDTRG